jgi:hypothetical protein
MDFKSIAKNALSMSGVAGALAVKAVENSKFEEFEGNGIAPTPPPHGRIGSVPQKQSSVTSPLNIIILVVFIGIAVFMHIKCHKNDVSWGIIPAILCPSCYLIIFFFDKKGCPSELEKTCVSMGYSLINAVTQVFPVAQGQPYV